MQKHILLYANLIICALLLTGFVSMSAASYYSNTSALKTDIEYVSILTAESLYYQIDTFFSRPVNVSLTMSNDSLLKQFLAGESSHLADKYYLKQLQDYLYAYQEQYGYDPVFLVSAQTDRYYGCNGSSYAFTPDNPKNTWYYDFLRGADDYALNVNNSKATENEITAFVDCKIDDNTGRTIGVVGIGMTVPNLRKLLQSYDQQYGLKAMLIDGNGTIRVSSENDGNEKTSLFDNPFYAGSKTGILGNKNGQQIFWTRTESGQRFVAAQYIPNLKWYLVVENNAGQVYSQFGRLFLLRLIITILMILLILYIINRIIFSYNKKTLKMTVSQELEYQNLLREATEGLYESVFELDITHDRAGGESTMRYFESLGMSRDTPYHEALKIIAKKQIKEEFAPGYLTIFAPENVLEAYHKGLSELYYDFMITNDGEHYRWMRIRARLFYWNSDQSVRMITYRQDITAEKEHETEILQLAQYDPFTGIYNKSATKKQISNILEHTDKTHTHALLMIDIDHFKQVNDSYGHAAGDCVIQEFAAKLKAQFRETDICGRSGGDEFMIFLKDIPGREWLKRKMEELTAYLHDDIPIDERICTTSASIGAAIYPEAGTDFDTLYRTADSALYQSKEQGRNCFTIYHSARKA